MKKSFKDSTNPRNKKIRFVGSNASAYITKYFMLGYTEMMVYSLSGTLLFSGVVESKLQMFEILHKFL